MKSDVFSYYLQNRPLFLALIRSLEIPYYCQYADFNGKVLDFGSGDGFFMHCLRRFCPQIFKKYAKIYGLEISKRSLDQAAKLKAYGKLVFYDGQKIPFENGFFDTVVSNCVFEHLPDLAKNMKELYRVLKPGGKVYATVMADKWEDYLLLPKKFWRESQKHHHLLSVNRWQAVFRQAGFKIVKTGGYLDKNQSRWVEGLHFVSLPYLFSYRLFGDWSKPGGWYRAFTPVKYFVRLGQKKVNLNEAGGVFFGLQK